MPSKTPGEIRRHIHRCGVILITLAILLFSSGCVRRRLTIRSNPPGAMVYVDDQQIGTTPVSTSFTYYGTRKIKLVKDQFETMTTYTKIATPWYQIPPIDFFAENVWGREIRDERVLDFQLLPQRVVPTHELLSRANGLRSSQLQGFAVPIPDVPVSIPPAP